MAIDIAVFRVLPWVFLSSVISALYLVGICRLHLLSSLGLGGRCLVLLPRLFPPRGMVDFTCPGIEDCGRDFFDARDGEVIGYEVDDCGEGGWVGGFAGGRWGR